MRRYGNVREGTATNLIFVAAAWSNNVQVIQDRDGIKESRRRGLKARLIIVGRRNGR
jgi:hypothetical protein